MPVSKRRNRSLHRPARHWWPPPSSCCPRVRPRRSNSRTPASTTSSRTQSSSIPVVMTAKTSTAGPVNAGDSITLEEIKQELKVPPAVFVSGYNVGVLKTGLNKIPTEVQTFIRGTNTVQETQATNKVLERKPKRPSQIPTANRATGDETATPGVVKVTYNNQTWTAGPSGPINFREATVLGPKAAIPPGFTISKAGILIESFIPGGITVNSAATPATWWRRRRRPRSKSTRLPRSPASRSTTRPTGPPPQTPGPTSTWPLETK